MALILVRYAEVGLKSRAVRRRFEAILIENMMGLLAHRGVEALVRRDNGRIFVEAEDAVRAADAVLHVFGVASVSEVISCGSGMEEMREVVAGYSRSVLADKSTFKIRARRSGQHAYTSMDAQASIGEAVLWANEDRGITVDVHDPHKEIFVEIRDAVAYIFSDYQPGPGGLPMGSQGRVLVVLEDEKDAVAAWLIMKRGCKAIAVGKEGSTAVDVLRLWDPLMKCIPAHELGPALQKHKASAVVYGYGVQDIALMRSLHLPVPAFYPIVGMDGEEIAKRLASIKK
ncbi:MAG: THUMP domain-containing protein [Methanomassiliicoccales archaeon]